MILSTLNDLTVGRFLDMGLEEAMREHCYYYVEDGKIWLIPSELRKEVNNGDSVRE